MAFFLLERFELDYAGGVTVGVFSVTWIGLIQLTNMEMKSVSKSLTGNSAAGSSRDARGPSGRRSTAAVSSRQNFARRLKRYAQVNTLFGTLLCIFQVLSFNINTLFKDDISSAAMNLGFDVSCFGVAYGYVPDLHATKETTDFIGFICLNSD